MRQKRIFANVHKIRSLDFARSSIEGTGSLSPRARRALSVYVVLVKMDYQGVTAPMGAIADAVYRCSNGESQSIRTLQRAHVELEERGFIKLAEYRPGNWSKGAVITFNLDAFAYWTQKQGSNVTPIPTPSHNVVSRETICDTIPHTTTCHPSEGTRNNSRVNSPNIIPKMKEEPRAGARAIDKSSKAKRKNPILFSLVCVLAKMSLYRADRRRARARAEIEIKAAGAGVDILNPCGVDWAYWEKRWDQMAIGVRESTMRREIIPYLLESSPTTPVEPVSVPEGPGPTADEIKAVRMALESRFSMPEPEPEKPAIQETKTEWTGNEGELAILIAARARINGM